MALCGGHIPAALIYWLLVREGHGWYKGPTNSSRYFFSQILEEKFPGSSVPQTPLSLAETLHLAALADAREQLLVAAQAPVSPNTPCLSSLSWGLAHKAAPAVDAVGCQPHVHQRRHVCSRLRRRCYCGCCCMVVHCCWRWSKSVLLPAGM